MRSGWFKKRKLQPTLVVLLSIFILLLMGLLSIVMYYSTSRLISSKLSEASLSELEQVNSLLNQRMTSIKSTALSIVINPEIKEILARGSVADTYEQIRNNESASRILSNAAYSRSDISEIMIVTDRLSIYNYSNPNGFYELSRIEDKPIWAYVDDRKEGFIPPRPNDMRNDGYNPKILTYFHEIAYGGKSLGYVFINLQFSSFKNLLQGTATGNRLFYTDENNEMYNDEGDLLSGSAMDEMLRSFADHLQGYTYTHLDSSKYLSIFTSPNDFGWRIILFKPYKDVVEGISGLFTRLLLVVLICFILAVIAVIYFSRSITQPLKRLIRQMNKIGHGNFDIQLDSDYTNEIGQLNERFRIMSVKIHDLMEESEREQNQLREMELRALQSQINPHFLYNTLDAINWMAIRLKAPEISKMTSNLGKFFRLSLNKGRELTTIAAELEHLNSYIHIMRYKHNNRFEYEEDIAPELLSCETIKIILQPLVENCFVHGLGPSKGEGQIRVTGRMLEDYIQFDVWDSGTSVDVAWLNQVLQQGFESRLGYGIHNVNQRIQLHNGSNYGLTFVEVECGTLVQIRLPIKIIEEGTV
ncbi:sensor histidine kinase [Paenibacillus riograndensis]|uniref:Putative membrane protein n=1 Tax=Paenibacillus riograndensis SBR5 TaxID=1073571 RepID=A0A0E4CYG3_9BACL|nr:sensor histidine kinase [Paenibacillus riograndensis]CQR57474.1 putative membrane protein [Paenibacillus riograndensis SBR5]